jgi:uncharacterized protein (DUF1778 family)
MARIERTERLELRLSKDERDKIRKAATDVGLPEATWARMILVSTAKGRV